MSARARFEIVRTDAEQPWHARFRAANGRIAWTTENYARKSTARFAIDTIARTFSPLNQCWVDEGPWTPDSKASVRIGVQQGAGFAGAHRVPIRVVDERTP